MRLARLPLRLRIFLFFFLFAAGSAVAAATALAFAWYRADSAIPTAPLFTVFIIFVLLNTALALGLWRLFDENIACAINKLAIGLRLRAHARVDADLNADTARYLGDLAPAIEALSSTLDPAQGHDELNNGAEAARLFTDREHLTALLSEIPLAIVLLNKSQEIVLYDTQAAAILSSIAPPRLKAPLSDYFDLTALPEDSAGLHHSANGEPVELSDRDHKNVFNVRLKSLASDSYMLLIDVETEQQNTIEARPLVFDFDLINTELSTDFNSTPLTDLSLVVFDTETTGLSVKKDNIVQLAAVRVLNGRIVDGEIYDTYVNPHRAIPKAATRIHGVTNAKVADAPDISEVCHAFDQFAKDAVLVAHNAPFDIGLLQQQQSSTGLQWNHPVIDTVLLSAVVFGITANHTLDALCDRLQIAIPKKQRHTALGDAKATAEVVIRLLPLLQAKGIVTIGQLLQETKQFGRLLHDLN